ncbi:MAG: NUDIX domain-containing protein [Defluviitaleaceae bacterium]|nr:NUDIX domain-containing protein [Defluviitaleaceae bacterium]
MKKIKKKIKEKVLVVKTGDITNNTEKNADIISLIDKSSFFVERSVAETDTTTKQIIPYVALSYQNNDCKEYFLVQRLGGSAEKRLVGGFTFCLGGHINEKDGTGASTILACIKRELKEEVGIDVTEAPIFLGIINESKTDVDRVHLGLAYELQLSTKNITIQEPQKLTGNWANIAEIAANYDNLESWSKIVYDNFIIINTKRH